MRALAGFVKTMVVGGLLFLFPLVFVTFVVGRALALMMRVTRPLVERVMPTGTIAEFAVLDIAAIIALLTGCLVAGLVAQSPIGRAVYSRADSNLASLVPGYATMKARLGDAVGTETQRKTVLIQLDDQAQLGLEIERLADGRVVAFLPGAPDAWAGTSVIVDAARVTPIDLDLLRLTRVLRDLGLGTAAILDQARTTTPPAVTISKV